MSIVLSTPRWSILEKVLSITSNDLRFLDRFFYHWPIRELVRLGQTNLTLYCMVRAYLDKAWNVRSLLRRWFRDPERLLTMMRLSSSILHGLTVLTFFYRAVDEEKAIELCTPISHVFRAVSVLNLERYVFQPRDRLNPPTFDQALRQAIKGEPETMHALAAERSIDPTSHLAARFEFSQTTVLPDSAVKMHWVYLNVVTFEPSFSSFSTLHTLVTKRTFMLLGRGSNGGGTRDYYLVANGVRIQCFAVVSGGQKVYNEVEIGRRFLGDSHCWVLPIDTEQLVAQDRCRFRGPCFEVFDFTTGYVDSGAYLGIREPFIASLMIAAQSKHLAPGVIQDFPLIGASTHTEPNV
ncbi:hypothetical protein BKA70DRAFT_1438832 [Coprinopsis sp. MPI-PUGE-AT-0042]|nr:hypothetical protein BKA70DRAFT_1438832 [Coprinopsis sp. MPI-PUGE-AT-0042]